MRSNRLNFVLSRGAAVLLVAAAATLASCGSSTEPAITKPTSDLTFLRPATNAPPLANPTVSFYAVRGKNADVFIWYRPAAGRNDSTQFMEFKLAGSSLVSRPDGSAIAEGDSLLITINVVDPQRMIIEFQPTGLVFSSKDPARLRIWFTNANADYDGDGVVNSADTAAVQTFSLWRQEAAGAPWFKVFSTVASDSKDVDANIPGFTSYAIAF